MVGAYNLHNAALALATAFALELNMRKAIESLESFPGVHRRMTILHKQRQRIIVDDYAHNPGKIRSAIAALRATWPTYRLCVVFQGHRYQRLKTMYNDFISAFTGADLVIVAPVFSPATDTAVEAITPELLALDITRVSKVEALASKSLEDVFVIAQKNCSEKNI